MKHALTRIVTWGHEFLAEVVSPGDLVVDLTAGNGQDTLALFRLVGKEGQIVAFDIQHQALVNTRALLESHGAGVRQVEDKTVPVARRAGVDLVSTSHENLKRYLRDAPQGIIANLGYLPGSDRAIITRLESTLSALRQAVELLAVYGRMTIVAYPGHAGGDHEAAAVGDFFARLPEREFQVLQLRITNRPQAPVLFVAEKC